MVNSGSSTSSGNDSSDIGTLTRLNVLSLLAQAGRALKNDNPQRAAVLLGAAALAPHSKGLSYAIQGVLTMNDVLNLFSEDDEEVFDGSTGTQIPIE